MNGRKAKLFNRYEALCESQGAGLFLNRLKKKYNRLNHKEKGEFSAYLTNLMEGGS